MIAQFLIGITGNRASPVLWISAAAVLSLVAGLAAWRIAAKPSLQPAAAE
jgi:hypothetical protein